MNAIAAVLPGADGSAVVTQYHRNLFTRANACPARGGAPAAAGHPRPGSIGTTAGVLMGNQPAGWFGVAVVGLSALDQMFFLGAYPFWSLVIIAVDVVALYALCAYGSRENLAA